MTPNATWPAALIVVFAFLRLINYARWAWGQGYRRGAAGTYVVAFVCLVVPFYMLLRANL